MKKITENTLISEVLDLNPNAAEILMEAGLGCIGCMFSQAETIKQGLEIHGFSEDQIKELLFELNKQ